MILRICRISISIPQLSSSIVKCEPDFERSGECGLFFVSRTGRLEGIFQTSDTGDSRQLEGYRERFEEGRGITQVPAGFLLPGMIQAVYSYRRKRFGTPADGKIVLG
jgi:hypothetical protein